MIFTVWHQQNNKIETEAYKVYSFETYILHILFHHSPENKKKLHASWSVLFIYSSIRLQLTRLDDTL